MMLDPIVHCLVHLALGPVRFHPVGSRCSRQPFGGEYPNHRPAAMSIGRGHGRRGSRCNRSVPPNPL